MALLSTDASRTPPPARPRPGATWQANILDASAITKELNRLWVRFGADARETAVDHPDADRGRRQFGVVTRASTLNLTAVGRSRAAARRVEEAVTHLSGLYPSRATILVSDPERPADADGLDVRVALLEQEATKGRPAVLFECVVVEVAASAERHLASIASPLLVADLPDFLWWAGEAVSGSELFHDLIAVSDRLIVDSAAFAEPAVELRHLASLLGRTQGCPKASDFAWARGGPWRQLVTQGFDPPSARNALTGLDRIDIGYGGPGSVTGDGFTAALLLAGWLGSRLGWRSPGEVVPVRDEPGSWRATLRAGTADHQREVVLVVHPSPLPAAASGLGQLTLSVDEGRGGSFHIERIDALGLSSATEVPTLATSRRLVYADVPTDAALLAEELSLFGRDPVFEEALGFAAELAPTGAHPAGTS